MIRPMLIISDYYNGVCMYGYAGHLINKSNNYKYGQGV